MARNIHIGFGDSATDCILEAIENSGLSGDGAIPSRDDFTQGPISKCISSDGIYQRIEYWESVNEVLGYINDVSGFYSRSIQLIDILEAEEITIWIGDSCHDILATAWLLSYLKAKNFKWFIVNLTEFDNDNLINGLPAVNLAMYTPNQLRNLYTYRRPMDDSDTYYFATIWQKACSENSHYRIQKDDKIISVDQDYFDQYILSHIQDEYELTSIVIGRILRDGQHRLSDTTVEWNLRKMINKGWLEYQGVLTSMTSYSIRKAITRTDH